ncbi:MAG TPA: VPLPA-CTERM sorting domain-containing protein [Spongiibacteraceae bacterium]|jgi:hypothetical protein
MKKSLLALAFSIAAVNAHASWFAGAGPDPTSLGGNGEALLTVFDNVAGKSYGLDLGVRYNDLVSGAAFNGQTIAADLSVFGGNYTNAQWMVTNSSATFIADDFSAGTYDKYGFMLTTATNQNRTAAGLTPETWANVISSWQSETINNPQAALGLNSGTVSQNSGASASTSSDPHYIGGNTWGTYFNSQVSGTSALGTVGGSLKLTLLSFSDADGTIPLVRDLGTVSLSATGLTFNQGTPAVPVPAAAWLMGSALFGLGGVARSRRRKA